MTANGLLVLCGAMLTILPEVQARSLSFPIYVPPECVALAQREGVPTVIENKYQAVKARYKLYRLKKSDPEVRECRAAVARLRRAYVAKD